MLKPIDLTVLAYIVSVVAEAPWTQSSIAIGLGVSQSNVHRALRQLDRSGLLNQRKALRDLLVHAVRHVYPAELGAPARGLPTAHAHPAIAGRIRAEQDLVWPFDGGEALGTAVAPLHPCVPGAAHRHPAFHEFMALLDVLRVGRTRERALAIARLDEILGLP